MFAQSFEGWVHGQALLVKSSWQDCGDCGVLFILEQRIRERERHWELIIPFDNVSPMNKRFPMKHHFLRALLAQAGDKIFNIGTMGEELRKPQQVTLYNCFWSLWTLNGMKEEGLGCREWKVKGCSSNLRKDEYHFTILREIKRLYKVGLLHFFPQAHLRQRLKLETEDDPSK